MNSFPLAVLGLLALCALFLLPPLLRRRPARDAVAPEHERNLAILRDQLAELENEAKEGSLAPPDLEEARTEMKRRILEESAAAQAKTADAAPSPRAAIVVVLVLALAAGVGYPYLGNPAALDPARREPAAQAPVRPQQIEAMVAKLAEHLKTHPEDEKGWAMLARSYKVMNRPADAAAAYAKAEKLVFTDAALLADYAEALAMSGQGMKGKPVELVQKALALDPENGHALFLAGAAALEAGQARTAADYWEKVLPQLDPESELYKLLRANIDKIRAEAATSAGAKTAKKP